MSDKKDSGNKNDWPVMQLGRHRDDPRGLKPTHPGDLLPQEGIETETYIPKSALLSDEAIDAAARLRNGDRVPLSLERDRIREELEAALQAASQS